MAVIKGGPKRDRLVGGSGDDTIRGYGGDDTLIGLGGNDLLDGGAGADVMEGGAGDDLYIVDNAGDQVIEAKDGGNDRILATVSFALAGGEYIETLTTRSSLDTADIDLTGNEFDNALWGDIGNNRLDGRAGADKLHGRKGDDIYVVDNADDQVFEAKGEGNDRVLTTVSYTLAAGQSIETLSTRSSVDTANINLTGNELANSLWGDAGNNILDGGAAADKLYGRGGDDTYIVDNVQDRVIEAVGGGNDTVKTSVSFTLEAGQEIETLETSSPRSEAPINLTGNEFANTLIGNAGDNILDGGGGADIMFGGNGGVNTFYVDNGDDKVMDSNSSQPDQIFTTVSYTLDGQQDVGKLSVLDIAGTDPIDLTGRAVQQGHQPFEYNSSDTLVGNDGNNILNENGDNDYLTGNGGKDTFVLNKPYIDSLLQHDTVTISDFAVSTNAVHDTLFLPTAYYGDLTPGQLDPSELYAGPDADSQPSGQMLLYDTGSGILYDGSHSNGGFHAVIARFATPVALTAADIFVG